MRGADGMRVLCHRGSQKSLLADCVVAIRAGHSVSWDVRRCAGLCSRPYTALIDRHSGAIGRFSKRDRGKNEPYLLHTSAKELRRKRSIFSAVQSDAPGPFQPRRLSACVSAIGGLAAARGVLSARQLMTRCGSARCIAAVGRMLCFAVGEEQSRATVTIRRTSNGTSMSCLSRRFRSSAAGHHLIADCQVPDPESTSPNSLQAVPSNLSNCMCLIGA